MKFDPTIGVRIAPAWQAALDLLADHDWHHRRDVVDTMLAGSTIKASTCSNVLRNATIAGLIDQSGEWHGRGDDRRYLRLPTMNGATP